MLTFMSGLDVYLMHADAARVTPSACQIREHGVCGGIKLATGPAAYDQRGETGGLQ